MSNNQQFTLRSCDGKDFVVSEKAAFLCGVVQDMVKVGFFVDFMMDLCFVQNIAELDRNEPIPIPNVTGETMGKVIVCLYLDIVNLRLLNGSTITKTIHPHTKKMIETLIIFLNGIRSISTSRSTFFSTLSSLVYKFFIK